MLSNFQIIFNFHCENFQNRNSKFQLRPVVSKTRFENILYCQNKTDIVGLHMSEAGLAQAVEM